MGQRSLALTGPSPSTGSPTTFRIRPRVSSPTGIVIVVPVSTACIPRTMPSVGFIEMQRTRFSPRCCATSAITSIGMPVCLPSSVTTTALWIGGSWPSGNSTSRTGPITWTTRPVFCSAIANLLELLERRGARNDLDQFLRDPRLPGAVVGQGERVDHLPRVLRRRLHRGHPRAVLRGRGLEQHPEDRELEVPREELREDGLRVRLVDVLRRGPRVRERGLGPGDREDPVTAHDLRHDRLELVEDRVCRVDAALDELRRQVVRDLFRVRVLDAREDPGISLRRERRRPALPVVEGALADRQHRDGLPLLLFGEQGRDGAVDVRVEGSGQPLVPLDDEKRDLLFLADPEQGML